MRKFLLRLFLLALLALPVALAWAALEPAPLLDEPLVATPESAMDMRTLVHRVRAVTNMTEADRVPEIEASLSELNGALAFVSRVVPGLRGRAGIGPDGLGLRLSAPAPAGLGWLNLELLVPPFDAGPRLARVRLGGLELPPGLALALAEGVANLYLGAGTGTRILASVPRLDIGADGVVAHLRMSGQERTSLTRRVARALRGEEMPQALEIRAYYVALREALETGALPDTGTVMPHLRFVTQMALDRARPETAGRELTAALFALTKVCGADGFRLVVGRLIEGVLPEDEQAWSRHCKAVVMSGRVDSKRHFITSAALVAASTRKVSFTIGEYKELFDILHSGGFDFTDIVADSSGIRYAQTFLAAPLDDWPALIARLDDEAAVIASFDGIPGLMPGEDFATRFGDVDSPAYAAMLAEIEARVDLLALHRPLARP